MPEIRDKSLRIQIVNLFHEFGDEFLMINWKTEFLNTMVLFEYTYNLHQPSVEIKTTNRREIQRMVY